MLPMRRPSQVLLLRGRSMPPRFGLAAQQSSQRGSGASSNPSPGCFAQAVREDGRQPLDRDHGLCAVMAHLPATLPRDAVALARALPGAKRGHRRRHASRTGATPAPPGRSKPRAVER